MRKSLQDARLPGFLTNAGFVLLAVPVCLQAAWIFSSVSEPVHSEAVVTFNSFLPGFMNLQQAAITSLIFSALALIAGFSSLLMWPEFRRSTTLLIVISGLLLLLNLFQLM